VLGTVDGSINVGARPAFVLVAALAVDDVDAVVVSSPVTAARKAAMSA
jgi:hypothetical protein